MTHDESASRPSRRTIAKGAAWAVPAVAVVGVPAPAYAESGGPPTVVIGDACKLPGNSCGNVFVKGYIFEVTLTNTSDKPIYLYNEPGYLIEITEDSDDIDLFFQAAIEQDGDLVVFPYLIPVGDTITLIFNAGENGNSQNVQGLTLGVCIPWGHTVDPADDTDGHLPACDEKTFDDTPPEQGAQCMITLPPDCGGTASSTSA